MNAASWTLNGSSELAPNAVKNRPMIDVMVSIICVPEKRSLKVIIRRSQSEVAVTVTVAGCSKLYFSRAVSNSIMLLARATITVNTPSAVVMRITIGILTPPRVWIEPQL